ncbi:hypothetical protein FFLO_03518 [Filobasidium floriforme]|uniref:Uncharacterized protein n=1 Tax=Filobasidium floriforme TaxID=5210 RepID=A0A8K0JM08_9TREE|nr:uncharacterized protein HD553DRAFT_324139 [Filobasidium floriforme]KAG7535998.1 hypothetical protein FFLO_03518 [Filobasidium floriforme]KAH8084829.1 hypothetical protein HD553DRAFT_324139 [Filobasidium floriforme]
MPRPTPSFLAREEGGTELIRSGCGVAAFQKSRPRGLCRLKLNLDAYRDRAPSEFQGASELQIHMHHTDVDHPARIRAMCRRRDPCAKASVWTFGRGPASPTLPCRAGLPTPDPSTHRPDRKQPIFDKHQYQRQRQQQYSADIDKSLTSPRSHRSLVPTAAMQIRGVLHRIAELQGCQCFAQSCDRRLSQDLERHRRSDLYRYVSVKIKMTWGFQHVGNFMTDLASYDCLVK